MATLQETGLERLRKDDKYSLHYDPMDRLISVEGVTDIEFNPSELSFPIRVVEEINSICNMRCLYCSQYNNNRGPKLKTEDVLKNIDEANTQGAFEMSFRGAEATLHPDFYEIWKHANEKDFLSANLITNGLVLDEQKALSMLQNVRSKLIVSLDGPDEINSRFRDPRQYKRVMSWLIPILRVRGDQIVMLTTVYNDNLAALPDFCDYLSQIGLRHHHFSLLKRLGNKSFQNQEFSTLEEIQQFEATLNKITASNPNYFPSINSPFPRITQNKHDFITNVPIPRFTEYHCGAGIKVMADGRIGISQIIYFDDEFKRLTGKTNSLGSVGKVGESLQVVWDRSKEIRKEQAQVAQQNYQYFLGLESQW
ncbi:MAG: hypothetical protein UV73_C0020G0006 [Candidatus Gottesmanbacteria bacterium GW2011_GWA2_43_14]|uniref:Radical SAM core domain-containing protein n=1 Tax=Candidatus Gottesmanbacteria bacterium GW2011_GWA2_43_14 TaxID=1618443 RepID=A0A0G1DC47_9BACT|nr:MAG: hypothetical protein UV73_C0020G0006 [Candidatus Gottesmanbacteria bacterium GW2011_GWA2_43_14]